MKWDWIQSFFHPYPCQQEDNGFPRGPCSWEINSRWQKEIINEAIAILIHMWSFYNNCQTSPDSVFWPRVFFIHKLYQLQSVHLIWSSWNSKSPYQKSATLLRSTVVIHGSVRGERKELSLTDAILIKSLHVMPHSCQLNITGHHQAAAWCRTSHHHAEHRT